MVTRTVEAESMPPCFWLKLKFAVPTFFPFWLTVKFPLCPHAEAELTHKTEARIQPKRITPNLPICILISLTN